MLIQLNREDRKNNEFNKILAILAGNTTGGIFFLIGGFCPGRNFSILNVPRVSPLAASHAVRFAVGEFDLDGIVCQFPLQYPGQRRGVADEV